MLYGCCGSGGTRCYLKGTNGISEGSRRRSNVIFGIGELSKRTPDVRTCFVDWSKNVLAVKWL